MYELSFTAFAASLALVVLEEMGMGVDESRENELVLSIDDLVAVIGFKDRFAWLDGFDYTVLDDERMAGQDFSVLVHRDDGGIFDNQIDIFHEVSLGGCCKPKPLRCYGDYGLESFKIRVE